MNLKNELYQRQLEVAPYGTLFFSYGICVDCNPWVEKTLGCSKNTIIGSSLEDTQAGEPIALLSLKQRIFSALEDRLDCVTWDFHNGSISETIELTLRSNDQGNGALMVYLLPLPLPSTDYASQPLIPALSGVNEECHKSLIPQHLLSVGQGGTAVYYDGLTQLPNRQLLIESVSEHLARTKKSSSISALLMMDLDHFKDINDSWGHDMGDQVIRMLAAALFRLVGKKVLLARLAADEFLLFLPDIADTLSEAADSAKAMAEKAKGIIAHPIFIDGHEFSLTSTVGIALLSEPDITAERALQYADTAMYEAKRQGRNGVAFFDRSISEKAQKQIRLNAKLRKAVDNQEFALYIQPQISIQTGELVGGEALLRWVNTEGITNMPADFIPLLEASGLIVNVGQWVIRTGCEYIRSFLDAGLWKDHMRLGINISPRQFNDPLLLDVIKHSLKSYNIKPQYLNFEITENLVIENVDDTIKKMNAIKLLGAMFSIDDFGLGYSSMIYLKKLPFDQLKIDREFIRDIFSNSESLGVVEAIMAVSKQYGLSVTAEGVEDDSCLDILKKMGCDHYQGAYYSMPVPVDQFRKMLVA